MLFNYFLPEMADKRLAVGNLIDSHNATRINVLVFPSEYASFSKDEHLYHTERKKRRRRGERFCFRIICRERIVSICFMSKQENAFKKDDRTQRVPVLFILLF